MLKKPVITLFCLVALSLLIIGCGGGGGGGTGSVNNPAGPALTSGETASLSGTVLFDNTPTPFASVFLYKSEKAHTAGMAQMPALKGSLLAQQVIGDGAWSTTTNGEGVYNFSDIPVGQYTLIAMRDENHQFVQTGVLLGQVTTLNPQLTPTGKISGKVTQTIGGVTQNISGAFVYITGTSYIALTNSNGIFTINNVPSNSTSGAAYELQVISAFGDASAKTGITVRPGETTDVGTFALAAKTTAYQTLSGSLIAGTGVTAGELSGIFVMLTRQEDNSLLGTNTDASGNYSFSVTMPGNYVAMAVNTDYQFEPGSIKTTLTSLSNSTTALAGITMTAMQGSNVSGTVTWGAPTSGWTITEGEVILQNQSGTPSFVARKPVGAISPANFSFSRVPPGNYTLTVDPAVNGFQSSALNVAVTSGADVTGANLSATFFAPYISTPSIAGNVLTLNGGPFTTAAPLTQAAANGISLTATDTTGWTTSVCKFDISNLPPGNYSAQATNLSGTTKVNGNQSGFIRQVMPPTNIATFTSDQAVTITWHNVPMVSEVELELYAVQVPNPLQIGGVVRVPGTSHTFSNLTPDTDYFVKIRSRYNNMLSTYAPDVQLHTQKTGIENIESLILSSTSGQMVFGFEVYNNTAYVAIHNDIGQPITLLAYQNMTSPPVSFNVQTGSNCFPRFCSLAANSSGVFLSYADPNGDIALTQFNSTLTSIVASKSLTLDYGFSDPSMAAVRSFSNRPFLVTRDNTSVEILELSGVNIVASASVYAYNAKTVKSADLAHDPVTNTLYLGNFGPGEGVGDIEIRAFSNMSLSIANPPIVGLLMGSDDATEEIVSFGACNKLIFCSRQFYDGTTANIVDSRSGFVHELNFETISFGSDRQNRMWVDYSTADNPNNDYFAHLDTGMTIQQTLARATYDISNLLNQIKLDQATGMMHLLHRDLDSNNLAVYRYDSNY